VTNIQGGFTHSQVLFRRFFQNFPCKENQRYAVFFEGVTVRGKKGERQKGKRQRCYGSRPDAGTQRPKTHDEVRTGHRSQVAGRGRKAWEKGQNEKPKGRRMRGSATIVNRKSSIQRATRDGRRTARPSAHADPRRKEVPDTVPLPRFSVPRITRSRYEAKVSNSCGSPCLSGVS
jgi:hypothetical protein